MADQGSYILDGLREKTAALRRLAAEINAKASDLDSYHRAGRKNALTGLLTFQEWKEFAIRHTLKAVSGNRAQAARILKINVKTIYKYLRRIEHQPKT